MRCCQEGYIEMLNTLTSSQHVLDDGCFIFHNHDCPNLSQYPLLKSPSVVNRVQKHILESNEVKYKVYEQCIDDILEASEIVIGAFKSGHKVLLCGNGGSAADCQHMATEFMSKLSLDRPGLPAIALTTDTSFLTARSNDVGFDQVFKRQVEALGKSGDVLVAISTSGKSINVIFAIYAALKKGMRVILLTGDMTVQVKIDVDVRIAVPSSNVQYIQESHVMIEHILADLVEQAMFGKNDNK